MTIDADTQGRIAALEAENARLRSALTGAQKAAETTGELVSAQFVKIEETMALLEEKVATEHKLQASLSRELDAAELRERELDEARRLADAANQAKSSFLASMSHELRTPLNAIIGYSEFLVEERGEIDEEESADVIAKIVAAGRHLLGLINDILDLSKIEAGKMELFVERLEVASLIDDVLATIQPLAAARDNRLVLEVTDNIGRMHSDATKLRQILFNLLSNAAKFTEGGELRLRARRERREGDDWVVIEVEDTGIGIPEDKLDRLFQSFSQAELSTSSRYGGTGLGLAISKRLCLLMGGDIHAQSELGAGSCFRVDLPAIVPGDEANRPAPARTPAASS